MQRRTFGVGAINVSYHSPQNLILGNLDSLQDLTLEARLRVLQIKGATGAYFQVFNGLHRYLASFSAGQVRLFNSANTHVSFPIVDLSAFHRYRLKPPENTNTMRLYVDNVLTLTAAAPAHTLHGFGFGDGITASGNNADVDWDYLRVEQAPGPALFSLPFMGLVGVLGSCR